MRKILEVAITLREEIYAFVSVIAAFAGGALGVWLFMSVMLMFSPR
jgi:hypothetical protein